MKKSLILVFAAALGLAACGGSFQKGPAGLMYKIHKDAEGDSIKEGDFVSLNIIAKTDADSVLFDSYEVDRPSQTLVPKPMYDGDLFTAIKKLSKGDSATIKVNIDSAEKKNQPRPQGIKGQYIVYTIKIEDVIAKKNLKEEDFQMKVNNYFKGEIDKAKKAEAGKVEAYVKEKNLKTTKTASGLQYVITKEGSGAKPVAGDSVTVHYTGMLLGGKVFDTSNKELAKKNNTYNPMREPYNPIGFRLGRQAVIAGWEEGLTLLNKGAKATFIVPSSLGYGEQGMPQSIIGPFTPLVFEVELVNFVPQASLPVAAPQAMPPAPQSR